MRMMAGGSVVVRDASTEYRPSTAVTLFADLSFFCLQKLPTRSQLIRDIQANGGRVVKDEKLADYIIADHARKDAPPGSYSWTLVTTAIAHGALPDPAEHYAGPRPGSIRDLGSAIPGKTTRTPFTHEEDKQLWQWVEQEKSRGGTVKGNDIYKRLEQVNPRHTFQSWRDRYLKKLMANPPTGMEPAVLASAAPSPPTALDRDNEEEQETGPPAKRRRFETMREEDHALHHSEQPAEETVQAGDHNREETDVDLLLRHAADIEDTEKGQRLGAFGFWSKAYPRHPARQWIELWHNHARPNYQEQLQNRTSLAGGEVRPSDPEGNGGTLPKHFFQESSAGFDKSASRTRVVEVSSEDVTNAAMNEGDEQSKSTTDRRWKKNEDSQMLGPQQQRRLTNHDIDETVFDRAPLDFVTEGSKSPRGNPRAESLLAKRALQADFTSQLPRVATLTEANLVAQEAQHKAPVLRGADLPADDENHDQSNFVEYLQQSLQTSHRTPYFAESRAQPTSRGYAAETRSTDDEFEDELDEVIRSNMEWPSSPQQTHATGTPAEVQIEGREDQLVAGRNELTDGSPPTEVRVPQAGATIAPRALHDANQDPSDDVEHQVDLSVAFPEVGGGFDPSSDHDSSQAVPEEFPEAGDYYDKVDEPERPEYDTPRRKAPVIEISSTSIPSSPVSDFEGRTYDWRVNRPLRTQEIDTAEAQLADLSMPLPLDTDDEEGDEDAGHERAAHDLVHTIEQHASSQAIRADSPTPVLETDDDAVQLKSWMATMQVRGHDESAIIQAAKCTSLQLELAELVLMHIRGGKGVPNDVPGVWTEYEDEQLEGGNARAIRLLENKHGWDACRTRLDYLEKYRDAA